MSNLSDLYVISLTLKEAELNTLCHLFSAPVRLMDQIGIDEEEVGTEDAIKAVKRWKLGL